MVLKFVFSAIDYMTQADLVQVQESVNLVSWPRYFSDASSIAVLDYHIFMSVSKTKSKSKVHTVCRIPQTIENVKCVYRF